MELCQGVYARQHMSAQMSKHPQLRAMLLIKKLVMCIELVHGMLCTVNSGCDELLSFKRIALMQCTAADSENT